MQTLNSACRLINLAKLEIKSNKAWGKTCCFTNNKDVENF